MSFPNALLSTISVVLPLLASVTQRVSAQDLALAVERTETALRGRTLLSLTEQERDQLLSCYVAARQLRKAEIFAEWRLANDRSERSVMSLANVFQLQGRDPEAISLLDGQLPRFKSSAKYLFTLAYSHYNMGHLDHARELAAASLAQDATLSQAAFLLGNIFGSRGDQQAALTSYELAVKIAPANYLYHCQLGLLLSLLNRSEEAEAQLRITLRINPKHAPAHFELGKLFSTAGRLEESRAELDLAVKCNPAFEPAYYLLSRVARKLGDHDLETFAREKFETLQAGRRAQAVTAKQDDGGNQ